MCGRCDATIAGFKKRWWQGCMTACPALSALYIHLNRNLVKSIPSITSPSVVFQILEFAELDKMAVHLLCRVLRSILINEPDFVAIFSRIAGIPKLKVLRDSLKVFMRHFLYRKKRDESIELLRKNIELAETALNSVSKLDIKFD